MFDSNQIVGEGGALHNTHAQASGVVVPCITCARRPARLCSHFLTSNAVLHTDSALVTTQSPFPGLAIVFVIFSVAPESWGLADGDSRCDWSPSDSSFSSTVNNFRLSFLDMN